MTRIGDGGLNVSRVSLPCLRRAEQTMGMPAITRQAWTRAEVLALIDANPLHTPRYELVDGELLVTPGPAGIHQKAVLQIILVLAPYLERTGVGELLTSPSDVQLEPESLVQPDLYAVPPEEGRRLIAESPARDLLLAIEVVSPSSGRHDRGKKRAYYHRNVPEYWIFDTEARYVERWLQNEERSERLHDRLEWHASGTAEPFVMELDRFFAKIYGE